MTDRTSSLLGRIADGDELALRTLHRELTPALTRWLTRWSRDRSLVEEIVQDTFTAVWTHAERFDGRSSGRTWVFGVARNHAHNTVRRRRPELLDDPATAEALVDAQPTPDELALARVCADELASAVERLSAPHREILHLTFAESMSYAELAEVLGVPVGTVKSRLAAARRALARTSQTPRRSNREPSR